VGSSVTETTGSIVQSSKSFAGSNFAARYQFCTHATPQKQAKRAESEVDQLNGCRHLGSCGLGEPTVPVRGGRRLQSAANAAASEQVMYHLQYSSRGILKTNFDSDIVASSRNCAIAEQLR
jgi:hypothetical protein